MSAWKYSTNRRWTERSSSKSSKCWRVDDFSSRCALPFTRLQKLIKLYRESLRSYSKVELLQVNIWRSMKPSNIRTLYFSSMVMRDFTLRSSPQFGSLVILRMFLDELVTHIIINRLQKPHFDLKPIDIKTGNVSRRS